MLTPGEIAVGMDVTVLEAEPVAVEVMKDGDGHVMGQRMSMFVDQYKGMPLKVLAVNLPYLLLQVAGKITTLDTRTVKFMELTPEYVQATLKSSTEKDIEREAMLEFMRMLKPKEKE